MADAEDQQKTWSFDWAVRIADLENRGGFRRMAAEDPNDAGSLVGGTWPPESRMELVRAARKIKNALVLLASTRNVEEGQRQYIGLVRDRVNQLIEYFQRRDKWWSTQQVWTAKAPDGRVIKFPANDPAAKMFKDIVDGWYGGLYEQALINYLWPRLGPGDVFVDVGAHTGYISAFAAATGASVFALEIQRSLIPLIEQVATINAFDHLRPLYLGASSQAGLSVMRRGWTTPAAQLEGATNLDLHRAPKSIINDYVPTISLDDAFLDDALVPKIIKIDAEGHEIGILDGARELIALGRTIFVIESHSSDHVQSFNRSGDELLTHFDPARWSFGQLSDDGVSPIASTDEITPDERDSHPKIVISPRPA